MKGLPFKGALVASAAAVALLTTPPAQAQVAEQLINELEQMDAAQRTAVQRALRDQLQVTQRGSDRVSLLINGQMNKALVYADNGNQSRLMTTDNTNSGSRFRLIGNGRINEDMSVGTQFEIQTDVSDSSAGTGFDGPFSGASQRGLSVRKSELWFDSATMGRVWLGQGSMATDSISYADVTGTAVVLLGGNPHLIGGALNFFDSNPATNMQGVTVSSAVNPFHDGPRRGRVRYDTPALGGILTLSSSWANADSYDFAAHASGRVEGHRWVARFGGRRGGTGNANNPKGVNDWSVGGSASIATSFGLVAQFGAGRGDAAATPAGDTRSHMWQYGGKLGWNFDASPLGTTAVTASWYRGRHQNSDGDRSNAIGAEFVQNIDAAATEVFAAVRRFDYSDSTAASYDNIWLGTVGSRIRF